MKVTKFVSIESQVFAIDGNLALVLEGPCYLSDVAFFNGLRHLIDSPIVFVYSAQSSDIGQNAEGAFFDFRILGENLFRQISFTHGISW